MRIEFQILRIKFLIKSFTSCYSSLFLSLDISKMVRMVISRKYLSLFYGPIELRYVVEGTKMLGLFSFFGRKSHHHNSFYS